VRIEDKRVAETGQVQHDKSNGENSSKCKSYTKYLVIKMPRKTYSVYLSVSFKLKIFSVFLVSSFAQVNKACKVSYLVCMLVTMS
jgi:hypothetical protein